MTAVKPGPKAWILRCRLHKTTVLLYAEPTTSLSALKEELRKSLLQTHPSGGIETSSGIVPIPDSIDSIILGKQIDPNNSKRGWERIGDEVDDIDWAFADKGKGKAVAGKGRSQNDNSKVTVQSVGLADGALVGVIIKGATEGDEEEAAAGEANGTHKDIWDIISPRLETSDDEEEEFDEDDAALSDSEIPIPASTTYGSVYNT